LLILQSDGGIEPVNEFDESSLSQTEINPLRITIYLLPAAKKHGVQIQKLTKTGKRIGNCSTKTKTSQISTKYCQKKGNK
jgi:hypothetical protein